MKKSEKNSLREKTPDELRGLVAELRDSMLKGRFAVALEGKTMGVKYRAQRRQIARISTILSQKAAGTSPAAAAPAAAKATKTAQPAAKKPAAAKKSPAAEKAKA
ncbi:MAG: 50S ribosomal protein L29 [Planctomycetes bacterium]|nr:50S ribosomal protein L29 [Planctomycetota bacterium]